MRVPVLLPPLNQHVLPMTNALERLRPNRKITGISAILLPLVADQQVDWQGFDAHVRRTYAAGLTPAINMDTGYGNLIDDETREEALRRTQDLSAGQSFVAGAFVADQPGNDLAVESYQRGIEQIQAFGGTPILFQSYGLAHGDPTEIADHYRTITRDCDQFYAFELGEVFAPFGKVYSLDVYRQLMEIPACKGAKHSSLSRELEWQRLELRDQARPDFKVFTGNDLAIDMVMYGSDYLLGLSTFAPDAFALRDSYWETGDSRFYELNDVLQYLGAFAFRPPVPAYKHNAAMFLNLREQIQTDLTYPGSPQRPESDREVLAHIADDLQRWLSGR